MYDLAWKIDQVNGTAEEGRLSHRRFKTRYNDFRIFTIFSTYLPDIFLRVTRRRFSPQIPGSHQ